MPLTPLRRCGHELAGVLASVALRSPIVIAIPRRGVVVAREISRALDAELDVVLATRVYVDRQAAGPIGAVAMGGIRMVDEAAAVAQGLRPEDVEVAFAAAERRLVERLPIVRGNVALPDLRDRDVIVVDDAAITGLTMQVAIGSVSQRRPARIVAALGLSSYDAVTRLEARIGDVFALERQPTALAAARHDAAAIALCPPLGDEEVQGMLHSGPSPLRPTADGLLELDGISLA